MDEAGPPHGPGAQEGRNMAVTTPEGWSLTFSGRKERACSINSLIRRLE